MVDTLTGMSAVTGISVEEFLAGDWPRDAQLLDGEVVVTDPTLWHQEVAARIIDVVRRWTRSPHGGGLAGYGGNWTLASGQVYKPDVWWVADPQRLDLHAAGNVVPPDLVVEVRSPGTWRYDIGPKREVYREAGVGELWLVDTPASTVLVNRRSAPDAMDFDVLLEIGEGETLTSPMLPGFALGIDALFA